MAILVHMCPHPGCRTDRMPFQVKASVLQHGQQNRVHALLECPKCHQPACALLLCFDPNKAARGGGGSLANGQPGLPATADPTDFGWKLVEFWPTPPEMRLPEFLPDEVKGPLVQAERNFEQAGMGAPAGGSYRRALDVGTKVFVQTLPEREEYANQQLNNRINMLRARNRITPELADWAHEIKGLGNDSMHEIEEITREELLQLRGFTELVLTYLFTLPAMLEERKAAKTEA